MKLKYARGEKNQLGARGESCAARYLRFHGYRILARNERMRRGELDIVARRGGSLVFVEVKTRTVGSDGTAFGRPADAVDRGKRERLIRAAEEYMLLHPCDLCPRMDVIEVYVDPHKKRKHRIVHIKSAFGRNNQ